MVLVPPVTAPALAAKLMAGGLDVPSAKVAAAGSTAGLVGHARGLVWLVVQSRSTTVMPVLLADSAAQLLPPPRPCHQVEAQGLTCTPMADVLGPYQGETPIPCTLEPERNCEIHSLPRMAGPGMPVRGSPTVLTAAPFHSRATPQEWWPT